MMRNDIPCHDIDNNSNRQQRCYTRHAISDRLEVIGDHTCLAFTFLKLQCVALWLWLLLTICSDDEDKQVQVFAASFALIIVGRFV